MTEPQATDQEPSTSAYVRLPTPVLAVGLIAFLAVLLAAGVYANNNLRPQGVLTPTPQATAVPLAAPTAAPTAVPTTAPSPTTRPQPTATATPQSAVAAAATPKPTTPESPATLPTVEPTLAAEVGQAYENFWRVRSQAVLELDATHLSEVMDGDYLKKFEASIQSLAEQGRAIKTEVSLNYTVVLASADSAVVHDAIEDDSYYVAAGTQDPLTEPANDLLRLEVTLHKIEGVWKVVDSVSAD